MATVRRRILSIAMLSAVTAGGAVALADAPGGNRSPGTQTAGEAVTVDSASSTAALKQQLRALMAQDAAVRSALHDARHNLATRVHANEVLIAHQRALLAQAAAAAPPVAPVSVPAPAPTARPVASQPAPNPSPTAHGTTGASGGSGSGHGGDDGGHGGDDGGGDD